MANQEERKSLNELKALLNEEDSFSLKRLIQPKRLKLVLRNHFFWPFLLLGLGMLVAFLYLRYSTKTYSSSSTLKFEIKKESNVLGIDFESFGNNNNPLLGEMELIRSPVIINLLIEQMWDKLSTSYFQEYKFNEKEQYPTGPFKVSYKLFDAQLYEKKIGFSFLDENTFELTFPEGYESYNGNFTFNKLYTLGPIEFIARKEIGYHNELAEFSFYFVPHQQYTVQQFITSNLEVSVENLQANTINVSFKDHVPQRAAEIVNGINALYIKQTIANKNKSFEQTIRFIDSQLDSTERELQISEARMQNFAIKNKSFEMRELLINTIEQLDELYKEKEETFRNIDILKQLLHNIKQESLDTLFYAFSKDKEYVNELKEEINNFIELNSQIKNSLVGISEETYAFKQRQNELSIIENRLITKANSTIQVLEDELRNLDLAIKELENQILTIPEKETELKRITRVYDLTEGFYLIMMQKKAELGIAKSGTVPDCRVLSPARVSLVPISPNRKQIYFLFSFAGLIIGVGLIFSFYAASNKIIDSNEIASLEGVHFIGGLSSFHHGNTNATLLVDQYPQSSFSESLRLIRSNINFLLRHEENKIISITSTISGEGKTFVGLNLSAIYAMAKKKTILIDLDLRRPKINIALEAENLKGVSTILSGKHHWRECVHKSRIEHLDFLTSGPIPPNPSELLLTEEFNTMLMELKQEYDYIFIDNPPIGIVTDSITAIGFSDLCIYIFRNRFSKLSFKHSLEHLVSKKTDTVICSLLNGAKSTTEYGYGYGYGKGSNYYVDYHQRSGGVFSSIKKKLKL